MTGIGYFKKGLMTWTCKGRARRREYWYFVLFNGIISYLLMLLGIFIFGSPVAAYAEALQLGGNPVSAMMDLYTSPAYLPLWIYTLIVLVPQICLTIRRLHDTNRGGWWIFVGLIPFIGGIVLLVFMLLDSNPYENKYGNSPKLTADEEVL